MVLRFHPEYSFSLAFLLILILSLPIKDVYQDIRFYRIPIAYLILIIPYIAYLFFYFSFIIAKNKFKLLKYKVYIVSLFLLLYMIILWMININTIIPTIKYIIMWLINISSLFLFSEIYRYRSIFILFRSFKYLFIIINLAIIISIVKFIIYNQSYINPFPFLNRNLVGFILITIFIFNIYLFDLKLLSTKFFTMNFIILLSAILLLQSRSALLGVIICLLLYITYKKFKPVHILLFTGLVFIVLVLIYYTSSYYMHLYQRLESARNLFSGIIHFVKTGEEISVEGEFIRYQVLIQGIHIMNEYFIFGTGPGLYNYIKALNEKGFSILMTPHNFYIYFFTQFGIIGFILLVLLIVCIFKEYIYIKEDKIKQLFISILIVYLVLINFHDYMTMPLLWFILGIGLGVGKNKILY